MEDRAAISWMHRRAGFGLSPVEAEAAQARGVEAELQRLVDPDAAGLAAADPVFDPAELEVDDDAPAVSRAYAVGAWLTRFLDTERPFEDRLAFLLHGWLVSSMDKVQAPALMAAQVQTYTDVGGGSFPALLRTVTTDPAMLVYLDGRTSTGGAPNENYGRELLELFTLGVGNYTEDDVQAASRALTGWVVQRGAGESVFLGRRHDDTPQTLLGTSGVNDVDSVIDAVVAHEAHAPFVAARIARDVLGDASPDVVTELAATYLDHDRELAPVVRAALLMGLDGRSQPIALGTVPWFAMAVRATGGRPPLRTLREPLVAAGQVPLFPPNVAGWPGGTNWFASGAMVARVHLATAVADATPADAPALQAARRGNGEDLAEILGAGVGTFGSTTRAALADQSDERQRLVLALLSPEFLLS